MSISPPSCRPPLTDSPWFWAYLFCTAGLVALFLAGPKYAVRQAQIERKFLAHEQTSRLAGGHAQATPSIPPAETQISLTPLYVALGALLAAAWGLLWWRHFGTPTAARAAAADQPTRT